MGLHLNYELALPGDTSEATVAEYVGKLHERARALPFLAVTDVVRFTDNDLTERRSLHGMGFMQLEDVAQFAAVWAREQLYCRMTGTPDVDGEYLLHIEVPTGFRTVAIGFALAPGEGSEPAACGLVRITAPDGSHSRWWWQQ